MGAGRRVSRPTGSSSRSLPNQHRSRDHQQHRQEYRLSPCGSRRIPANPLRIYCANLPELFSRHRELQRILRNVNGLQGFALGRIERAKTVMQLPVPEPCPEV